MKIAVVLDARLRLSPRPQANPRLCGDARGRHGSVREELAAGIRTNPTECVPGKLGDPVQQIPGHLWRECAKTSPCLAGGWLISPPPPPPPRGSSAGRGREP